jgi:hypothetical protein
MTAPTAADLPTVDVHNGLLTWASYQPEWVSAAVKLLIWHESWLRRPAFLADATRHYPDEEMVAIIWPDAARHAGIARASSSELSVLRFAIALATDQFGIGGLGAAHRQAFTDAFTTATGGA